MRGNSLFFRMHKISDIYFVGGFGTIQWIEVAEYLEAKPDKVVVNDPHTTLQVILIMQFDRLEELTAELNITEYVTVCQA